MPKKLTESLEDYLEAIAELIGVDGHAHAKEIAKKLQVKMPSVTGALRQLVKQKYIVYNSHYPVELTPAGKEIADRVIERHAILKKFFGDILGLPADKASETACRLEHIVDQQTVARFVLFSEAIERRSDAQRLKIYLTEAMARLDRNDHRPGCVLASLPPGTKAIVESFGRNLRPAAVAGIDPGDEITLKNITLDKTAFQVDHNDRTLTIGLADAENLWVKRLDGK